LLRLILEEPGAQTLTALGELDERLPGVVQDQVFRFLEFTCKMGQNDCETWNLHFIVSLSCLMSGVMSDTHDHRLATRSPGDISDYRNRKADHLEDKASHDRDDTAEGVLIVPNPDHERPKVPIFGAQVRVAPAARVVRAWR
jgi:hypothetical protein